MIKFLKAIIIILFFISCDEKKYDLIGYKNSIDFDSITKIKVNRGIIKLNGHYINSASHLVNKTNPKWLKDKKGEMIFIDDIDLPFVLFKKPNEKFVYIIKNNDTLKFKLIVN